VNPNVLGRATNRIECDICAEKDVQEYYVPCGYCHCWICLENLGFRWNRMRPAHNMHHPRVMPVLEDRPPE